MQKRAYNGIGIACLIKYILPFTIRSLTLQQHCSRISLYIFHQNHTRWGGRRKSKYKGPAITVTPKTERKKNSPSKTDKQQQPCCMTEAASTADNRKPKKSQNTSKTAPAILTDIL